LRIDLERRRDVIECPIEGVFDINGWDWRKLAIDVQGQSAVIRVVAFAIVYRRTGFSGSATDANPGLLRAIALRLHYCTWRGQLSGVSARRPGAVEKIPVCAASLLAVGWLESGRGVVPMRFRDLVETLIRPTHCTRHRAVAETQAGGEELAWGRVSRR